MILQCCSVCDLRRMLRSEKGVKKVLKRCERCGGVKRCDLKITPFFEVIRKRCEKGVTCKKV